MYFDSSTLFLLIVGVMVLSLVAQFAVKRRFAKYAQVPARSGLTGGEAAKCILESAGIYDVRIECVDGALTDHYDPNKMVLRLSSATMNGANVAAVSVAAHETGHVLQHMDAYYPLLLRNACVKSAGIGSQAAWPIFFLGIILSWQPLMYIGLVLYSAVVLFTVITLPVELNASDRALQMIKDGEYLAEDEMPGARKVLNAAAFTYVAAALMALLQLVRLLVIAGVGRRRD